MPRLRLLLADDHTLVRHGLRKILEERPDWEVVEEVGDGREAVRAATELAPDVAVIDAAMPLLNGIDATQQIVKRAPNTRVLMLSMHSDEAYLTRALQAGAMGYILKDSAGKDLLKGIEAVAAGKPFFSPTIERLMMDDYVRRAAGTTTVADRYETLSNREREIFQLIAEANTSREIADMLEISPATVETHRARILQKLDIHNTAELVLYAVRRGVVS
ncbi:MAG TPA: response regulator transcription factor [Vicinamibacterales bacterium]|nr:response regulator transcription factor [Vicinamibacterales bacterium]